MALQYEIYLYEEDPSKFKEIRRFIVDNDMRTRYEYLRHKVTSIFPNLPADFLLQWRDSEKGMILIYSDEELLGALSKHSVDNTFKLFIKEQRPPHALQDIDFRVDEPINRLRELGYLKSATELICVARTDLCNERQRSR